MSAGADENSGRLLFGARVIAVFGFLLSLTWSYVSNRARYTVTYLQKKTAQALPEYKVTTGEWKIPGPVTGFWLMTFVVPGLAAAMWLIFVIIAF